MSQSLCLLLRSVRKSGLSSVPSSFIQFALFAFTLASFPLALQCILSVDMSGTFQFSTDSLDLHLQHFKGF